MTPLHSIRVVANRTGLSPHVIRVWEKRYSAVAPHRTDSNRRFYSEEDVAKLNLLAWLTRRGHSIGAIARSSADELQRMAETTPEEAAEDKGQPLAPNGQGKNALPHTEAALEAIRTLDSQRFEEALQAASIELGSRGFLRKVVCPLAQSVGDLWQDGEITAAHEHFATAAIKVFLGQAIKGYAPSPNAPGLLVTTPAGQAHELGAVIAAAAAGQLGWRTTYLGPSLPALEIAGAARQSRSRAVALSVVYPPDDPALADEFRALAKLLPQSTALIVGGRAARGHRDTLEEIGARVADSPTELENLLTRLREPSS